MCAAGVMLRCKKGEFSWGGQEACDKCEQGWLCDNGITLPCASDGKVEINGTCSTCPPGSNCRNGLAEACPPGTYSRGGGGGPGKRGLNCPPGKFSRSAGSSRCSLCPPGKTSGHGQENCNYCGEAEITLDFGVFPCTSCATGTHSLQVGDDPLWLVGEGEGGGAGFGATYDVFEGVSGNKVEDLTSTEAYKTNSYSSSKSLTDFFEGDKNRGDQFGSRISGYFVVPEDGEYTFVVAGNDDVRLYLDGTEVCRTNRPTGYRKFTKDPSQTSSPMELWKGDWIWMEVLHKEKTGADSVSVGVTLPGGVELKPLPIANYVTPRLPDRCPCDGRCST